MINNETKRFGKTKRDFLKLAVLAIIIAVSNILVYIGLSNQINSLQSPFFTVQTIYGTLEQHPYPRFWEDPPSVMVYVVSPTPNSVNPYYLSERGNVREHLHIYMEEPFGSTAVVYDWLEMNGIHVGDKIEVDGLVWYRSDRWGNNTYTMLEWFAMRKR
jgi:hypothetical protein